MANHRSAIKSHKQSLVRRARGRHYRSMTRNAIKSFNLATQGDDQAAITSTYKSAESILRRVAGKGIIKKQTASRTISRLTLKLNKALAQK